MQHRRGPDRRRLRLRDVGADGELAERAGAFQTGGQELGEIFIIVVFAALAVLSPLPPSPMT